MGRLTTHMLDTANGRPAAGVRVRVYAVGDGDVRTLLLETRTNADGRCDRPLLEGAAFAAGTYELIFAAGAYFDRTGLKLPDPKFLDEVTIRFGIAAAEQHYHVPLLLSPFAYSTYRGS